MDFLLGILRTAENSLSLSLSLSGQEEGSLQPLESPTILGWDGWVLGLKLGNPAPII